jgi:hypothetical protein
MSGDTSAPNRWERLLEENLRLRGELDECHELLRKFAGGNYNFKGLQFLCDTAEAILTRAKLVRGGPVSSYADLDERLGVNRPAPAGGAVGGEVVVNQGHGVGLTPPHDVSKRAEDCPQCKALGWVAP